MVKNPSANAGDIRDVGSVLGLGRALGRGHGNPLQHSCLENPMDRGAWWATVHGVTQSWTQLKQLSSSSNSILEAWLSVNCDNRGEERTLLSVWLVSQASKDLKRSVAGRLFQKQIWRQS